MTRLRGQNAHEREEHPYLIKRSQRAFLPLRSQEDTVKKMGSGLSPDTRPAEAGFLGSTVPRTVVLFVSPAVYSILLEQPG